jgi:phage shock protein PspC (stress-responsive transcriptional regulator)
MNEVTRIHLGRQSFTISVDAQRALKAYIAEIEKHVHDKEVVQEIELRMAELLGERGISGDKVVLPGDVEYLKTQLGKPADFSDDGATGDEVPAETAGTKRLFRDTDNALLAGVAAGLANYFGTEPVIIRIVFILLTIFSGGVGILIYIVLWLLVPAATTSSEKLQMLGRPVTVDAIKKSVADADFPGAARRGRNTVMPVLNGLFRIGLKVIGFGFIVASLLAIFALVVVKVYMILHHGQLIQENLFPVGTREQWLANLGLLLAALVAIFFMLAGVTIIRRKWPLRSWATIPFAGVFLVVMAATAALSADIGPRVQARYQAGMHTSAVAGIQQFSKVQSNGGVDIEYIPAATYSVTLRYWDHPDTSRLKINTKNNVLYIDSTNFDHSRHCDMLCIYPEYDMVVQVAAPNIQDIRSGGEVFYPPVPSVPAQMYVN